MRRKLVFLDIDGTLTSPGGTTPPESAIRAIRRAREKGHLLFLCTGRNYGLMFPLLSYGFDGAIASAGGYVACGDKVIYDHPMEDPLLRETMETLSAHGICYTLEAREKLFSDPTFEDRMLALQRGNSELLRWQRAAGDGFVIHPLSEYDGSPVYKIVFMCEDMRQLEAARPALVRSFTVVIQNFSLFTAVSGELVNRCFNKGSGVRLAAEYLAFPLEDTIGFGDSMNDLEMIETVKLGVCMANGSEELKQHSHLVCPSVEADGLAWAFEHLGLL